MQTNPLRNYFTAGTGGSFFAFLVFEHQGTFREPSGNIRGTFREHSGRVERTPVSLHPNCQKHLKKKIKVPRLTQNTTCKHEYLGRGLTFREHFGRSDLRDGFDNGAEEVREWGEEEVEKKTFSEHSANIQ
jgi:hypothetical protein